jgi:hypothetical protein
MLPTRCSYVFRMILRLDCDVSLNRIGRLVFVMGEHCVLYDEVGAGLISVIT